MSVQPGGFQIASVIEGINDDAADRPGQRRLPPRPHRVEQPAVERPSVTDPPVTNEPPSDVYRPQMKRKRTKMPTSTMLPTRLADRARSARTDLNVSLGDLFKIALENSANELEHFAHTSRGAAPTVKGNLFGSVKQAHPATTQPPAEPMKIINFTMSEEDLAVLDRLVDQTGATSRGQLLTFALDHFFGSFRDN